MTRIYRFADDSMRGRMAGSPEAMKGTEYIAGELKRLGLQPAGDNGTYFQDVPFGVQTLDSSSTIQIGETMLKAGADFLANAAARNASRSARESRRHLRRHGDRHDEPAHARPGAAGRFCVLRPAAGPADRTFRPFSHPTGYKRYQATVSAAAMIATIGPAQFSPVAIRNAFTPGAFVQLVPDQPPTDAGHAPAHAIGGRRTPRRA